MMPTVFNKDVAVDVPNKFKLKTTPSLYLKWLLYPISRSSEMKAFSRAIFQFRLQCSTK